MNKKICVNALVSVPAHVTTADLMEALRKLGNVEFSSVSEYREAEAPADAYPAHAWLYVSSDESTPYRMVRSAGDEAGLDLPDEVIVVLHENGVCTEFYAETPCMAKYGSPHFVSDDYAAGAIIHEHGFVASTKLSVSYSDRGDDGSECYWLRIALPANVGAALQTAYPLPAKD